VAVIIISILLVLSSSVNAQLVFDRSAIDGSIGQTSVLDGANVGYGLQPFTVTADLASADGLEYNGAFSTDTVEIPGGNQTGLDVTTWNTAIVYISNLADALNGTPTARMEFNPLFSNAPNGQQFQDLITTELGPNGETHYDFFAVADLGESNDGNEHHQITETFDMDTTLTLQDGGTTTLGSFLTDKVGQTLYAGSVINNAAVDGSYEIAASSNLGTDGVLFGAQVGRIVPVGFAHRISAIETEPALLGDVNLDGSVTFADIAPFIDILAAVRGYSTIHRNLNRAITTISRLSIALIPIDELEIL